ncbi:hypothetical protein J2Y68_000619 [Paenarthrobacter nitroguajacolicus]|nr:hypothetical protein [Paenarthrobacter nitroguajacolicus]
MACHKDFARQTLIPVYFCDPQAPGWRLEREHKWLAPAVISEGNTLGEDLTCRVTLGSGGPMLILAKYQPGGSEVRHGHRNNRAIKGWPHDPREGRVNPWTSVLPSAALVVTLIGHCHESGSPESAAHAINLAGVLLVPYQHVPLPVEKRRGEPATAAAINTRQLVHGHCQGNVQSLPGFEHVSSCYRTRVRGLTRAAIRVSP